LAAANPADPKSWNRYAYVGNRPLNSVDPLGLYPYPDQPPCDGFIDYRGGGGGGGCAPSDASCEPLPPGCGPFFGCAPGPPVGGGGGGGPHPIRGKHGPWANGETLGLPTGLNLKPMTLADLIGLPPGTQCDFGVCGTIGNGFLGAGMPSSLSTDSSLLGFLSAIAQLKLRVGAGTGACAYYDILCQTGDPYACKAVPI
jgi:hypothetical protein